jgi:hypothetical protein
MASGRIDGLLKDFESDWIPNDSGLWHRPISQYPHGYYHFTVETKPVDRLSYVSGIHFSLPGKYARDNVTLSKQFVEPPALPPPGWLESSEVSLYEVPY